MALNLDRESTNTVSIKVFGIVLILWIVSGCYNIISGGRYTFDLSLLFPHKVNTTQSNDTPQQKGSLFIGLLTTLFVGIISLAASILSVYVLKWFSKVFVYLAIVLIWVYVILSLVSLGTLFVDGKHFYLDAPGLIINGCFVIILCFAGIHIGSVGIDTVSRIIENFCCAILFYPQSILVSFSVLAIIGAIGYFSVLVHLNSDETVLAVTIYTINLIGLAWIGFFFAALGYFMQGTVFATYHETEDPVTHSEISQSISAITKAHVGTIAYGTTVVSIFTQLRVLVSFPLRPLTVIFALLILFMLPPFRELTFAITVMQGSDFKRSTRRAIDLLYRAPLHCLVLCVVTSLASTISLALFSGILSSVIISCFAGTSLQYFTLPLLVVMGIPFTATFMTLMSGVATLITSHMHNNFIINNANVRQTGGDEFY